MNNSYISPFAKPVYVMLKPVGSVCNLACEYCYYLEKGKLYPEVKNHIMSEQLLEKFIKDYLECQTMPQVLFTWHGGETLMRPISFYKKSTRTSTEIRPWKADRQLYPDKRDVADRRLVPFLQRKQLSGWNINRRSAGISRRIPPEPPGPSLLLQSDEGNRVAEKTSGRIQCDGSRKRLQCRLSA